MLYQSLMIDKGKIITWGDEVYANFCNLNVSDGVECESFTTISIDSCLQKQILPASIFRQLCLQNCRDKEMIEYLNDNLF